MSAEYLSQLGILYYHCPSISAVDKIASERFYKNRDEIIVCPDKMGSVYEEKVRMFFNEVCTSLCSHSWSCSLSLTHHLLQHLHEDEEIRYILEGHGFFDVRDGQDEWVRIKLDQEDLIILPAGIFHRFTTDSDNVLGHKRLISDI